MGPFEIELIRVAYLAFAAVVALLLMVLGEWLLRRRFGEDTPGALIWSIRAGVIAALLIITAPVLGIVSFTETMAKVHYGMNATLVQLGSQRITLSGIVTFLFFFGLTLTASRLIKRALTQSQAIKRVTDPGTVGVIERLVHYVVLAIGLAFALSAAGVNLSGLVTAGAAFAVGIGFALQGVAQNFVSGLIILIERAIKPGDVLELEGKRVQVKRMGIRSTIVRSRDDEDLIVPNSTLAQSTVTNFTLLDRRRRVRATVGVAYESDMKQVFEVLKKAADAYEGRVSTPEPVILLTGFGASSVDFEVSVWTTDAWGDRNTLSELNMAIWNALKDNGITIAFPQLDVHLDVNP